MKGRENKFIAWGGEKKVKNLRGSIQTAPRVHYLCDNCNKECCEPMFDYLQSKRHYCSRQCRYDYTKKIPFYEQNAYKGVRGINDSKYIYTKKSHAKNPENISHLKSRRYAREKNATGKHTLQEWIDVKNKFNNRCAYCGLETKLTKDHIIPLSKGGSDFITNIQPLCRNCNSKKHNKIIYQQGDIKL